MSTSRPRHRLYQPDEDGILLHESSSQNYEENRPSLQVYKTQIKIASFGTTIEYAVRNMPIFLTSLNPIHFRKTLFPQKTCVNISNVRCVS